MIEKELKNKLLILIRPKEPFLEWARELPDHEKNDMEKKSVNERTSYMIPVTEARIDDEVIVIIYYKFVFNNELAFLTKDKTKWPKKIDFELFKKWFDYEIVEYILDIDPYEAETDGIVN